VEIRLRRTEYRTIGGSHVSQQADQRDTLARENDPVLAGPQETSESLATIHRTDTEEIRIVWAEYRGNSYVGLRLWTKERSGRWWPDRRRVCSFRLGELEQARTAIDESASCRASTTARRDIPSDLGRRSLSLRLLGHAAFNLIGHTPPANRHTSGRPGERRRPLEAGPPSRACHLTNSEHTSRHPSFDIVTDNI
jgi:hypothetical protein